MRTFVAVLLLALLTVGCISSTQTKLPMPPMPGTPVQAITNSMTPKMASLKSVPMRRTKSFQEEPVLPAQIVYTPDMTNVLKVSIEGTNILLAWPTNAWDYVLVARTNWIDTNYWKVAGGLIGHSSASYHTNGWRTTNGQWFEVRLPATVQQQYFQLSRVYSVNVAWDFDFYTTNISFRAYSGSASRAYTKTWNLMPQYGGVETNGPYAGSTLFTSWLLGVPCSLDFYLSMTAVLEPEGLESDYSNEVWLEPQNK